MRTFVTIIAAAAASTLTLAAAPAAMAKDAQVTWRGLDLQTEAGQAELASRVEAAAVHVCDTGPITGSRIDRGPSAQCLADARSQIRAQLSARMPSETRYALAQPNPEAR